MHGELGGFRPRSCAGTETSRLAPAVLPLFSFMRSSCTGRSRLLREASVPLDDAVAMLIQ